MLLALAYSKPAMTTVTRPSILHVSAAEGGGVDRYIRDIAANVPRRHFLWHVGSGIDVIEDVTHELRQFNLSVSCQIRWLIFEEG